MKQSDDQVAEVIGCRCAIIGAASSSSGSIFHCQAFVAKADGVRSNHVDQIPGDVACFVHGAQLGNSLVGAFVPDHFDFRMHSLVRLGIGVDLAFLVCAAPADDGHRVRHVGGMGMDAGHRKCGAAHQCCEFGFHVCSPC
jgi:hypothetical protein